MGSTPAITKLGMGREVWAEVCRFDPPWKSRSPASWHESAVMPRLGFYPVILEMELNRTYPAGSGGTGARLGGAPPRPGGWTGT